MNGIIKGFGPRLVARSGVNALSGDGMALFDARREAKTGQSR